MSGNQLKAGVVLSYVSMGIGYFVAIIFTPIMLRLLGQSEYGLYNLVASVVSYLGILNFGFGSAYVRYYSRYRIKKEREKIASLNGMFIVIFSVIGLIAVFSGVILANNTEMIFGSKLTIEELKKAKILMLILVVNLGISFPNIVFTSYITANERFIFQQIIQLIKIIVNPFVVLPILLIGYGSIGMVIVTTVLNFLLEIFNIFYCIRNLKMKISFKMFDLRLMKEMTIFSSYIFINLVVNQINWNVDKFILGRFRGTVAVAIYGIANQLFTYYMSLSSAISNVFIPRVHALVAEGNCERELTILFTKVGRVQFILLGLISSGIVIFGKPFFYFWAGEEYVGAYPILLLLAIPATIPLFQNLGIEIQRAKNKHKFRSVLYLLIAIGNFAISIPLVKLYGGIGAALGTAIGQVVGNTIIMNVYYHKVIGIDMVYFWREILKLLPSITISLVFGMIITLIFDCSAVSKLILAGVLFVGLYLFLVSKWGMNEFEKQLVVNQLEKITKKRK